MSGARGAIPARTEPPRSACWAISCYAISSGRWHPPPRHWVKACGGGKNHNEFKGRPALVRGRGREFNPLLQRRATPSILPPKRLRREKFNMGRDIPERDEGMDSEDKKDRSHLPMPSAERELARSVTMRRILFLGDPPISNYACRRGRRTCWSS